MTNPQRAWARGCCAFTSGDNENIPRDPSIPAPRELNISVKLLRCLNIEKMEEASGATFILYFPFWNQFFPHCPSFLLSVPQVIIFVYACPITWSKNRPCVMIISSKPHKNGKYLSNQIQKRCIFKQKKVRKFLSRIRLISSGLIICQSHAFEGFVPQCGRCCAAGRSKQKVTLSCLIFPEHGNPSQVVRSLWILGKGRLIMEGQIMVLTCWGKEK